MHEEPALAVTHLTKSFHGRNAKDVLHDVTFALAPGECAGLVGVSGCGKSTTARIIAGLEAADSGTISLGAQTFDARQLGTRERFQHLAMVFQQPESSFDPRKTLGWSIAEPMRARGWSRADIAARTKELLDAVELPEALLAQYPFEVSGGQCQRAAIARAVATHPRVLLCDEVTSALDVTLQGKIVALIRALTQEERIACLFITHDLPLLARAADRILVMDAGRIVEDAEASRVISAPQSEAAKALLAVDFFQMADVRADGKNRFDK